jgi:hypothetical protein
MLSCIQVNAFSINRELLPFFIEIQSQPLNIPKKKDENDKTLLKDLSISHGFS